MGGRLKKNPESVGGVPIAEMPQSMDTALLAAQMLADLTLPNERWARPVLFDGIHLGRRDRSAVHHLTVPPLLVRSALKAYRKSTAVTEFKEFAGRGHSLTIDSGWREIADYCLAWLQAKGLGSGDGTRTQTAPSENVRP